MSDSNTTFPGNCQTTAMGIMPHTNIEQALKLALSLDIPFWPQLPNVSFYEDMYVQASEGFPGIKIDLENKKLLFDRVKFDEDLIEYSDKMSDLQNFELSRSYSAVFHRFLQKDLSGYAAIRGQCIGPVSFGFRVTDAENKPIIYDDGVRPLMFDFLQKKVNAQRQRLVEKNARAFVWLDEPGLGWVFSGLSGYGDIQAKREYKDFLEGLEGRKALHLCANVNLPYLLSMGTGLLSFDAYQIEIMPKGYATAVANFIAEGGLICWGIVPTDSKSLSEESPENLSRLLTGYWEVVAQNSQVSVEQIARQSLIAPARCCLKNIGKVGARDDSIICNISGNGATSEEQVVVKAFGYLKEIAAQLKNKFNLQ
jgi:hypothetical protein